MSILRTFLSGSLALAVFSSVNVAAGTLAVSETWLTKSQNHLGLLQLSAHRSLPEWCSNRASSVQIGSYQAASSIDDLDDGLYLCRGEFVNAPDRNQVILFKIDSCQSNDPSELRKACPSN